MRVFTERKGGERELIKNNNLHLKAIIFILLLHFLDSFIEGWTIHKRILVEQRRTNDLIERLIKR
jgi:hypothetical protein